MIKLHSTNQIRKFVPVERVQEKIKLARESKAVEFALKNMTFDHRNTKPITVTGWDILNILCDSSIDVNCLPYTQNFVSWKFVPVNAYKPAHQVNWIYFNTRQLERRLPVMWEETLFHELVHIADSLSGYTFDHGDNDLTGDENSAPVKWAKFMTHNFNPKSWEHNAFTASILM